MPKIIKIGQFLTELFKKLKNGRFRDTVYINLLDQNSKSLRIKQVIAPGAARR